MIQSNCEKVPGVAAALPGKYICDRFCRWLWHMARYLTKAPSNSLKGERMG